jgi:prepilin-type N-terminal cleavage/methylation domain-containing protein
MQFFKKRMNKKGFSLIELIVVIAILAIIAAVAIPRFAGIQERSEIKADAATAAEVITAIRVHMADNNHTLLSQVGADTAAIIAAIEAGNYIDVPAAPQSGGAWAIADNSGNIRITWDPADNTSGSYDTQTVDENAPFSLNTTRD